MNTPDSKAFLTLLVDTDVKGRIPTRDNPNHGKMTELTGFMIKERQRLHESGQNIKTKEVTEAWLKSAIEKGKELGLDESVILSCYIAYILWVESRSNPLEQLMSQMMSKAGE